LFPEPSHSSHAYVNVAALLQVPLLALKVSPCSGVPAGVTVIWGAEVFAGAGGSTGPTGALVTAAAPPEFEAVTVTLTSFPTSVVASL